MKLGSQAFVDVVVDFFISLYEIHIEKNYLSDNHKNFRLPREEPPSPTVPSPTLETTDGGFTTDTDTEEPKKEKCKSDTSQGTYIGLSAKFCDGSPITIKILNIQTPKKLL